MGSSSLKTMKGKNYEMFFRKYRKLRFCSSFQYFEVFSMKKGGWRNRKVIFGISVKQRIRICIIKFKNKFTRSLHYVHLTQGKPWKWPNSNLFILGYNLSYNSLVADFCYKRFWSKVCTACKLSANRERPYVISLFPFLKERVIRRLKNA
jgi:hypothetical protein